jgi:hypothetical protein
VFRAHREPSSFVVRLRRSSRRRRRRNDMLNTSQQNSVSPASMANGRVLQWWTKEEAQTVVLYEWARATPGTDIHSSLVEV